MFDESVSIDIFVIRFSINIKKPLVVIPVPYYVNDIKKLVIVVES